MGQLFGSHELRNVANRRIRCAKSPEPKVLDFLSIGDNPGDASSKI